MDSGSVERASTPLIVDHFEESTKAPPTTALSNLAALPSLFRINRKQNNASPPVLQQQQHQTSRPMSPAKQQQTEDLPFDFNRFLEQMRSRSAEPIAKYLRRQAGINFV